MVDYTLLKVTQGSLVTHELPHFQLILQSSELLNILRFVFFSVVVDVGHHIHCGEKVRDLSDENAAKN
jgi:hypothetical protein